MDGYYGFVVVKKVMENSEKANATFELLQVRGIY